MDSGVNSVQNEVNNNDEKSFVIGNRRNMSIIERRQSKQGGISIEVLQYDNLLGSVNTYAAQSLWFMAQQNIHAKQIAIYINNDSVKIEPGAMSYFQGPLEMVSGVTMGNAIGRAFKGAVTGEKMAQPEYRGSGVLVLEPSFKHFCIVELDPGERIVVDKGMFYAAQGSVQVEPFMQRNLGSAVLGGEGIFQTQLVGPGIAVLEIPVPMCEINMIDLNNDVLRVDGNFAVLRTGNIEFTVERSAKTLIGSAVSGEGLVNVFRGTGQVWIAPTIKVYNALTLARAMGGSLSAVDMNTSNGGVGIK